MAKKIVFIRHAQAVDLASSDFQRSLDEVGKTQAKRVGEFLLTKKELPEKIIYSPAERTRETAVLVAKELHFLAENLLSEPSIYNAETETLLKVIQQLPKDIDSI